MDGGSREEEGVGRGEGDGSWGVMKAGEGEVSSSTGGDGEEVEVVARMGADSTTSPCTDSQFAASLREKLESLSSPRRWVRWWRQVVKCDRWWRMAGVGGC